jgi:nucleoside triphosphate pyrophosphatase
VRLILASASPRRAELLRSAGYEFDVHAVEIDERPQSGEAPAAYVERLAREKAERAIEELSGPAQAGHYVQSQTDVQPKTDVVSGFSRTLDVLVLGADTAVVIGDEILGKPHDAEDAARMLRRLSGRTHQVMTGICLRTAERSASHVEISSVTFAPLSEDQIAWYVASEEGGDKAGGYAIQGLASRLIPRLEGSYANVVGLPIAVVDDLIDRLITPRSVLASSE